jgi:TonB family protein
MASAPTFKATTARRGVPLLPIGAGVLLVIGVTIFALTRNRPVSQTVTSLPASELQVKTIGRPPEPAAPPVEEAEAPQPTIIVDPATEEAMGARERRRPAEREAPVRPVRPAAAPPPAPAPPREQARAEKPAPPPRPPPAAVRVEPDPPLPPPPQFVPAPRQEPAVASSPIALGPTYAREGYQKARQATPGCVAESLRLPRDTVDLGGESATVKFAVDETGKVSQFSYLSGPTDQRVANAIWAAIQRCEWLPGATAQGSPITLWVTMPIRFGK